MENLKNARKQKGYTQEKLSKVLGVSRSAISMWETGESQPDNNMLIELSDTLEVSVDYLLGRTDNPAPPHEIAAAHIDGEYAGLPPEGIAELEMLKEYIKNKYRKK